MNEVYANTSGSFELAWSSTETDWTYSVAWDDCDGDGDLDLAVANTFRENQKNALYKNNNQNVNK